MRTGLIFGGAATAALLFFFWWSPTRDRTSNANREAEAVVKTATPRAGVTDHKEPAPRPKRAPRQRKPAPPAVRSTFSTNAADLAEIFRQDLAADEARDGLGKAARRRADEEEDAREEAADELREAMVRALRRHPDLAFDLLARMDGSEGRVVTKLSLSLRFARSPELVAELQRRVGEGPRPIDRRAALLALETRDAEAWFAPAEGAYTTDPDRKVRDTAADVLARGLADRRYRSNHDAARATIASKLDSPEPADRVRALRVLILDRHGGARTTELVEPLLKDPDPGVRQVAGAAMRALNRRN